MLKRDTLWLLDYLSVQVVGCCFNSDISPNDVVFTTICKKEKKKGINESISASL